MNTCYTEKVIEARHSLERQYNARANRKKQFADLTKPNHTPTRYTRAKNKLILQMATPQAAST